RGAALLHAERPPEHVLRAVSAVRRERVLDLPLLLLLRRPPAPARGGRAHRRRRTMEDVLPDRRADVEARLRDGCDPHLPLLVGLLPLACAGGRRPERAAVAARDLGLPGPAALRLGADLRLRRHARRADPRRVLPL